MALFLDLAKRFKRLSRNGPDTGGFDLYKLLMSTAKCDRYDGSREIRDLRIDANSIATGGDAVDAITVPSPEIEKELYTHFRTKRRDHLRTARDRYLLMLFPQTYEPKN